MLLLLPGTVQNFCTLLRWDREIPPRAEQFGQENSRPVKQGGYGLLSTFPNQRPMSTSMSVLQPGLG
jgi:hypothetical protein